ncbi:bacterial Ig-like domain-containing protein [Lentilactobacillus kisonensis]|nr:bacterial Ig-like domain-containing protein [Lentilactobacillus kisonensis]
MAVPLTVAEGYNFNMPVASTSKDTVILKQATEAVYQNAITLNALTFRSIVLSDSPVKAASYNDLITNHEYDGISSLFDANGLPVTGNDHAKAAVEPTNTPGEYKITYTFNGVTKSVTATTDDKSYVNAKDFTVAYGSNWDSEKLNGITGLTDANGNKVTPPADTTVTSIKDAKGQTVEKVDTSKAGAVYSVTYTYGKASQTVKVTVGAQNNTPSNGGTTNDSTNTNNSNTSNNLWNPTTSLRQQVRELPQNTQPLKDLSSTPPKAFICTRMLTSRNHNRLLNIQRPSGLTDQCLWSLGMRVPTVAR